MDRRRFLRRAAAPRTEPFEVLPGVFVDGGPVDFRYRAARPPADPTPAARSASRAALAIDTGLEPYVPSADAPWDKRRARHLLRRTGVAAPTTGVAAVLALSPAEAVDAIVGGAVARGPDPEPSWYLDAPPHWSAPEAVQRAYWDANWPRMHGWRMEILRQFLARDAPPPLEEAARSFAQRMAMLWHNHFVTHQEGYGLAPWAARYWRTLQTHAFGDFRQFVHAIGLDPAMLLYLNGADNRVGAPNENYARELLELFTMGITGPDGSATYTQQDITFIARALTGYGVDYYGQTSTPLGAVFVPDWHDDGTKAIFGQRGRWGYDDVVRIVFEERAPQIAHRVATKLYREFVYDVPHEGVVADLAALLLANDFALEPAVRTLLASAHFFDAAALGARVRSPLEHHAGLYREIGARTSPNGDDRANTVFWAMAEVGQSLLEPPTVAGWPGGRDWLDTSRLTTRWQYASWAIWWDVRYRDLAAAMPNPWSAAALAGDLADAFLGVPLTGAARDGLEDLLLNGIPAYEWNPQVDGAEARIRRLVDHLLRLPEFQLA